MEIGYYVIMSEYSFLRPFSSNSKKVFIMPSMLIRPHFIVEWRIKFVNVIFSWSRDRQNQPFWPILMFLKVFTNFGTFFQCLFVHLKTKKIQQGHLLDEN